MTFIWMDMLWLLLLVPLLIGAYIWLLRRRKKAALRYANLAIVKQAMGKGVGWRRHVPPALLLLALTVLIVAVARPAAVIELASSRATVILRHLDGELTVEVVDDGVGGADVEAGSGLRGLAERVEALGGELRVQSPAGGGTRVRASFPCGP